MYTIRRKGMPRPKQDGFTKNFQFRLTAVETTRWLEIFEKAKKRNPYITETHFNRILVGLDEDAQSLLTERDRIYFQGTRAKEATMAGRAGSITSKPHIKEVSPKRK